MDIVISILEAFFQNHWGFAFTALMAFLGLKWKNKRSLFLIVSALLLFFQVASYAVFDIVKGLKNLN